MNTPLPQSHTGPQAFDNQWENWLTYAWHRLQDHIDLQTIIRVHPQTKDYLYDSQSQSRTLNYNQGQRPILEAVLTGIGHSEPRLKSDKLQDITDALLDWVYWEVFRRGQVHRLDKWSKQLIGGGTEEETLGFIGRTGTFECARLLATLLQIKNIPARLLLVFEPEFSARVCVEACVNDQWLVLDIANNKQHPAAHTLVEQHSQAFQHANLGIVEYPAKAALKHELPKGYPLNIQSKETFDAPAALRERVSNSQKSVETPAELAQYTSGEKLHGVASLINEFSANEPPMTTEVIMCAQTQKYLYSQYSPTKVDYNQGDRPVLEGLISTCVLRDQPRPKDDQDLVFAIHDWIFHQVLFRYLALFPIFHLPRFRYFGYDEEVASFHNRCDCYCSSRLAVSMIQTAGIPARLVYMQNARDQGGHTCFEAYVRGAWRFWDVSCHDYALNRQGEVANIWEIMSDEYCRTDGLRADPLKITPLKNFEYLSNLGIGHYPIADTTAHYNKPQGSFWYEEGSLEAKRNARFGI